MRASRARPETRGQGPELVGAKKRAGPKAAGKAVRGKARESQAARIERANTIHELLAKEYPDAECALVHRNPYELIVATILSAQCTDERVNMVTPALFRRYPDAKSLAKADRGELEKLIQSTGFFRNKARNLVGMAQAVVADHGGKIPNSMEALHALPGVGRKTANVVLGNAFGIDEGIVVDTHVTRLSQRLGFTKNTDAVKIEQDLVEIFPRDRWTMLSHLLISHGRAVCTARKPCHSECVVRELCPSRNI
jgi:endonuclease-3